MERAALLVPLAWLLLARSLASTCWLLLNVCGLRLSLAARSLYVCAAPVAPPAADPALAAEADRQHSLEAEVERLELAPLRAPPCAPSRRRPAPR